MNKHDKISEGDSVDHKLFGLGTVKVVDDRGYTDGVSNTGNGYPVTVVWEDTTRRETTVMHWALRKVSSPEVRPFIYWDKQWQPLREEWLKARREVERLCLTFDPAPEWQKLDAVMKTEEEAWMKMKVFINGSRGS
jgi:hypothetical protein